MRRGSVIRGVIKSDEWNFSVKYKRDQDEEKENKNKSHGKIWVPEEKLETKK